MSKPTKQDYRTADALIDYYNAYDKFGQREHIKAGIKRCADRKNKLEQKDGE